MRVIKIENNIVIEVKHVGDSYSLQIGEIETDLGEIRQIQQMDGTFIDPEPDPTIHNPTNTEIAQMIADLQADLAIAGVI